MSTPFHSINTGGFASQGTNFHTTSLPGLIEPNKTISAVVGYRDVLPITPHKETVHREVVLHGDVKKLDTQIVDQKEPRALSGLVTPSLAEVNSLKGTKGTAGIMNDGSNLLAKTSPNEGNAIAQAPKQDNLRAPNALNPGNRGTRDVTASIDDKSVMRARSQHSIAPQSEKAGSVKNSTPKGEILELRLYRVVLKELNKYKTADGKYNGIIRILDSIMLQTCYSLIKSNPGDMTPGTEDITLDGLNLEWFNKTAIDIREGRFKFSPARQNLIPKPNKPGEFRPLLIANPREKIIQKALQVLLNAIFDPHFNPGDL
ncbi:hypothetical protein C0995_014530 [Termitomyces sp. Mi166|nr:hypothetical protein C0995_014530 [Termitomyces sp. Mi166\